MGVGVVMGVDERLHFDPPRDPPTANHTHGPRPKGEPRFLSHPSRSFVREGWNQTQQRTDSIRSHLECRSRMTALLAHAWMRLPAHSP